MQGRMAPMQQQCFPLASNARRLASDRRNDDEQGGAHAALDRANGVDPYDLASELLWRRRSTGARQPSPHRSAADRYAAVQSVMPRVSHQAAIDEPALRSAALAELGRGQRRSDARGHQQWDATHAGLQISSSVCGNRSNRRLSENTARPAACRFAGCIAVR